MGIIFQLVLASLLGNISAFSFRPKPQSVTNIDTASNPQEYVYAGLDPIPVPIPCVVGDSDYNSGFICPEEAANTCHPRSQLCDQNVHCLNSADEGSVCETFVPARDTANSGGFVIPVNGSKTISLVDPAAPQEKKCTNKPCANGKCYEWPLYVNGYLCACDKGYKGNNCEVQMIEDSEGCSNSPCIRGQCEDAADRPGGYTCQCDAGWTGDVCDTNIDECANAACVNGICVDDIDVYTCKCFDGWIGSDCSIEEFDACSTNPCEQGLCGNGFTSDEYICLCDAGWTGKNCDTDIDECSSNPCVNGVCKNGINKYSCVCDDGYTGSNCQTNIDECSSNPCVNGVCKDGINKYSCVCDDGYTGSNCQTSVPTEGPGAGDMTNPCTDRPCGADMRCIYSPDVDQPYCLPKTLPCICKNNGVCEDDPEYDSRRCICPGDYRGIACEDGP